MELKLLCRVNKKVSKNGVEYYVLYVTDLGKQVFLTEVEYNYLNLLFGKK